MTITKKSARNKTLDITVEEGGAYLDRCLRPDGVQALTPEALCGRTICADSFAVLPLLPEGFADLAIIDPPYNLAKNYAGTVFKRQPPAEYKGYTARWLTLLLPSLKASASLYVCCDWQSSMVVADVLRRFEEEKRLVIRNRITWQREKGRGSQRNWKNAMEDIWFCTLSESYTFNLDAVKQRRQVIAPYTSEGRPKDWQDTAGGRWRDTHPSNFWDDISVPFWSMAENTAHPAQKPEKLIAKLILASSREGDVVLDPFLGSGTTSVVAKKLGRRYVGIERSEQYCVWAEKRLAEAERGSPIQGYADGVFWERNSLREQLKGQRRERV